MRFGATMLVVLGSVGLVIGCDSAKKLWPASMEQQQAVQSLAEARMAPPGSIPLGGVETLEDREDDTDEKSPFALDEGAAARGRKTFAVHCVACHGKEGRGDGPVSDKFPQAPNVRHVSICNRTDGYLYGTITAGGRAMPTLREGTTSRERWELVAYIRQLQKEGCVQGTSSPTQGGTP